MRALASWTIWNGLLNQRAEYIGKRFHRKSEKMLGPDQARSLLVQLLTIAVSADLKRRLGKETRISREGIAREIPELKRKLGIDRGV